MTSPQFDPYQPQYLAPQPQPQPPVPGPYSGAPFPPPAGHQQPAGYQHPVGYQQPVGYQPPPAPTPWRPKTGVLLAIVGGLLALCVAGGSSAAYVIENGIGGIGGDGSLSHRQPTDPCALLNKDAFGTDLGGTLEKSAKGEAGTCDYTFQHDSRSPEATGSKLRLYVEVSTSAVARYESQQGGAGLSRLPVECGKQAIAGHKVDAAGENADARLWCVDSDVFVMLTFHGYNRQRFNALELDDIMARIGRTALGNVPTK
ncbi:hypothetical protein ACQP2P_10350 [Dactylosporangium sp. CA-139114]|uniref:hypothetical protein n=1 Tax=Dactylosporangium sp. CA-139114 TaxID=3239931 RepID=UPI003D96FD61